MRVEDLILLSCFHGYVSVIVLYVNVKDADQIARLQTAQSDMRLCRPHLGQYNSYILQLLHYYQSFSLNS